MTDDELYHYGVKGMKWGRSKVSERRWIAYLAR